jgi:hypothetical protein
MHIGQRNCRGGVQNGLESAAKLCSEFSWAFMEWPKVLRVVQSLLNSTPSNELVGRPPLAAFAMIPPENPVLTCFPKDPVDAMSMKMLRSEQCSNLNGLQTSGNCTKKLRKRQIVREKRQCGPITSEQICNRPTLTSATMFWSVLFSGKLPKLVEIWQGPYRAVRFENEQVLEVEQLLS